MRQGSFTYGSGHGSLTQPKTPTDARTKRRLNTLISKAGVTPKKMPPPVEAQEPEVLTVKLEYKRRLMAIFSEHNPDKVENVPAILSKHGNNLHSIYIKVCKKYDADPQPEYTGPTKQEMEGAISNLSDQLRDCRGSLGEFQFFLDEALDAGEHMMLNQEELEEKTSSLESMIESARQAAGQQSEMTQSRMQGEINNLMTENKRVSKDKVSLLQLKHDLEDRINDLMTERDKDGDLVLKLNDDIEKQKHKIMELEEELKKTNREAKDELTSTKARLNRQLKWMKETSSEDTQNYEQQLEKLNSEATHQVEDLNNSLMQTNSELETEQTDNRRLTKQKAQLLQNKRELEEKIQMLEDEREKDGDLIIKLNDDIEQYKDKVRELEEEITSLEITLEQTKSNSKKRYETTVQDYENKLAAVREAKVEERIKFENEISNLNEELDETRQSFEDDIASLEHQLETTKNTNKRRYDDTVQKYENQLAAVREAKVEDRIRNENEIQNLNLELEDIQKTLEDDIASLQLNLETTKRTNKQRYDDAVKKYENQLAALRENKLEEKMRYVNEIQNLENELDDTRKTMEKEFEEMKTELEDEIQETRILGKKKLRDTISKYEHEGAESRSNYENQIDLLEQDLEKLNKNFEETKLLLEEDISDTRILAKKKLKDTIGKYEAQLQALRDAKEDERHRYEDEITNLKDQHNFHKETTSAEISALEDERDKDGDLIIKLNDDVERYKHNIAEMENEIYELENLLKKHKNDSERTLENTRSKLSRQMTFNKSKADEKHKEAQVKLDETEGHLSEKVKMLNLRVSELTDQLEYEQTQNGKKISAYNILKKKFDNSEQEMTNMMDDLIQKTNRIRGLEKQLRAQGDGSEAQETMRRQHRLQNLRVQELELEIERLNRSARNSRKGSSSILEDEVNQLKKDLKRQRDLVGQLQREKSGILSSSGNSSELTQRLKSSLAETKKKYEQSNETVIRLDEALRAALAKQDDFTNKITDLKGEVVRLQRKTNRAESFISETTIE